MSLKIFTLYCWKLAILVCYPDELHYSPTSHYVRLYILMAVATKLKCLLGNEAHWNTQCHILQESNL